MYIVLNTYHIVVLLLLFPILTFAMTTKAVNRRADGVIMNYDPYHPEMMEKYGAPGETDNEGFNPYTVRCIVHIQFIRDVSNHNFYHIIST